MFPNQPTPQDPFAEHLKRLMNQTEIDFEVDLRAQRSTDSLSQVIRKADLTADNEIGQIHNAIRRAAAQGRAKMIDCKPKCSYCCTRTVLALIPEVLPIWDHIENRFTPEQRAALQERLSNHEPGKTCPLLVDDLCSVYANRPLSCRACNSVNVLACEAILRGEFAESERPQVPAQVAIGDAVTMGTRTGAFFEALDNRFVDLGLALKICFDERDVAQRYLEGEDVFSSAKIDLPEDIYQARRIAQDAVPAYQTRESSREPGGKIKPEAAERINAFRDLFFTHGWFSDAMLLLGDTTIELFNKMQLPVVYSSQEEIEEWRQRFIECQQEFARADIDAGEAFDALSAHAPLRLAYQGLKDKDVMAEHGPMLVNKITAACFPDLTKPLEQKALKGRRMRVGYISSNLKAHSGAKWAIGWLKNHAEDIETFAFNVGIDEDDTSLEFKREAEHYYFLPRTIGDNARFIRSLELDVLIFTDALATGRNTQYSTFRLAPVQCAAWGSPDTTGLPTMDYYLSSELMEPENGEDQYTEKLIKLPGSGLCYPRNRTEIPRHLTRSDLGLPEDGLLVYLTGDKIKALPQYDHLYAEISGRLGVPIYTPESTVPVVNDLSKKRMEAAGCRIEWLPFMERGEYLRLLEVCDVVLDWPGFNGGHSNIEAIGAGKPAVTMAGEFMRARQGLAFLTQAGIPELAAHNAEEYVALACDLDKQRECAERLNADALYEDRTPVEALDAFLRSVVPA